ncbi:MAG TPA: PIN domain-containing protein [Candidatus Krumholzibacteriaceae bacterium]|nr:PIN domain-containing protein [Candidatus Krumholzibacteriaceae bacterium]
MLDNNVFVAAIKSPRKEPGSLRLILEIIRDEDMTLVGNKFLLEEMARYAEVFGSPTAMLLLGALVSKMSVIDVEERYIRICKEFMGTADPVDVVHAATCLQGDAVLVSNDKHFDRIRDEGVITVWDITRAMKIMLR